MRGACHSTATPRARHSPRSGHCICDMQVMCVAQDRALSGTGHDCTSHGRTVLGTAHTMACWHTPQHTSTHHGTQHSRQQAAVPWPGRALKQDVPQWQDVPPQWDIPWARTVGRSGGQSEPGCWRRGRAGRWGAADPRWTCSRHAASPVRHPRRLPGPQNPTWWGDTRAAGGTWLWRGAHSFGGGHTALVGGTRLWHRQTALAGGTQLWQRAHGSGRGHKALAGAHGSGRGHTALAGGTRLWQGQTALVGGAQGSGRGHTVPARMQALRQVARGQWRGGERHEGGSGIPRAGRKGLKIPRPSEAQCRQVPASGAIRDRAVSGIGSRELPQRPGTSTFPKDSPGPPITPGTPRPHSHDGALGEGQVVHQHVQPLVLIIEELPHPPAAPGTSQSPQESGIPPTQPPPPRRPLSWHRDGGGMVGAPRGCRGGCSPSAITGASASAGLSEECRAGRARCGRETEVAAGVAPPP